MPAARRRLRATWLISAIVRPPPALSPPTAMCAAAMSSFARNATRSARRRTPPETDVPGRADSRRQEYARRPLVPPRSPCGDGLGWSRSNSRRRGKTTARGWHRFRERSTIRRARLQDPPQCILYRRPPAKLIRLRQDAGGVPPIQPVAALKSAISELRQFHSQPLASPFVVPRKPGWKRFCASLHCVFAFKKGCNAPSAEPKYFI